MSHSSSSERRSPRKNRGHRARSPHGKMGKGIHGDPAILKGLCFKEPKTLGRCRRNWSDARSTPGLRASSSTGRSSPASRPGWLEEGTPGREGLKVERWLSMQQAWVLPQHRHRKTQKTGQKKQRGTRAHLVTCSALCVDCREGAALRGCSLQQQTPRGKQPSSSSLDSREGQQGPGHW